MTTGTMASHKGCPSVSTTPYTMAWFKAKQLSDSAAKRGSEKTWRLDPSKVQNQLPA